MLGAAVAAVLLVVVVTAAAAAALAVLLCSPWVELGLATPAALGAPTAAAAPPPLCLGELLALPGLTGRTGKGPQVLAVGEKVPPNWAMGRRGCLIWCMECAARRASWGCVYARGSDTGKGCRTLEDRPFFPAACEEDDDEDDVGWNETPAGGTRELRALGPLVELLAAPVLLEKAEAALEPGALM